MKTFKRAIRHQLRIATDRTASDMMLLNVSYNSGLSAGKGLE